MEGLDKILAQGGPAAALIVAVGVALYFIGKGWSDRRASRDEDATPPLLDAATANVMMRDSMRALRRELDEANERNDDLQRRNDELHSKLAALREHYEEQISDLRRKLQDALLELDRVSQRLRADLTD